MYKTPGYNSVSPYLIIKNAAETIEFLKTVFGAVELRRFLGDDGRIRHAEVRLDDTVIMMGEALPDWPAVECHLHVYVPDVDATFEKALATNATVVQEPIQKEDEDKRGGVKDSSGTTWWIATRVG
jgi:uncharacterized glyoxalase superfamily protein PhnB